MKLEDLEHLKYPWLAVSLSLMLPGLGNIYSGAPLPGVAVMTAFAALVSGAFYYLLSPAFGLGMFFLYTLLAFGVFVFGLVYAHLSARLRNRDLGMTSLVEKDACLEMLLSIIIPGLGHLYRRMYLGAVIAFVVWGLLNVFVTWGLLNLPWYLSYWGFTFLPIYTVLIAVLAHASSPGSGMHPWDLKFFIVAGFIILTVEVALFSIVGGYAFVVLRSKL